MHHFLAAADWQGFSAGPGAGALAVVEGWGAGAPILLVEQYLLLAKPVVRGLAEEGIVTHLARTDVEADARIRTTPYAAVVVDWNIPCKGGAALVRSWREDGLTVPVLILMPSDDDADLLAAAEAGADSSLPLLFSFTDLLARLQAWIGAQGAFCPPGRG